jgi:uncharacterized protein (TIGR02569 family)
VAWEEAPIGDGELLTLLARARRAVRLPDQLVHGDLLGNVLFAEAVAPAVIDWSPYWRPASWGLAIAAADALCWHGAGVDVVRRWSHLPDWGQMLVRALIFRIATRDASGPGARIREPDSVYRPVVALAIAAADEVSAGRRSDRA